MIQAVARQLMAHESKFDLVVRYGGDEFLLLIERIARNDALDVAEMIRAQIEVISIELQIDVSVSMGVAVGAENWLTLFQKPIPPYSSRKPKERIGWKQRFHNDHLTIKRVNKSTLFTLYRNEMVA